MYKPNRAQLLSGVKPLTQSLFLECGYTEFAIYTLKDYDHTYKGKKYLSIKKLYIEFEDTTEYEFANQFFLGWDHWQRIVNNKLLSPKVESWRRELELKIRAVGVRQAIELAKDGNFQAAKWLSDRGFDKRAAGRPSKEQVESEAAYQASIQNEFSDDITRLVRVK